MNIRDWFRPRVFSVNSPKDDGRGRLLTTDQDINLGKVPVGITRDFYDTSHGIDSPTHTNRFPAYDSEAYIPHLWTPRGIIPTHVVGKTIDDVSVVPSMYVGNHEL
jgi:hypothetical protein